MASKILYNTCVNRLGWGHTCDEQAKQEKIFYMDALLHNLLEKKKGKKAIQGKGQESLTLKRLPLLNNRNICLIC